MCVGTSCGTTMSCVPAIRLNWVSSSLYSKADADLFHDLGSKLDILGHAIHSRLKPEPQAIVNEAMTFSSPS